MNVSLFEKIDTFIGRALIVILCLWTVFETTFPFFKDAFIGHEMLLLAMRVFAVILLFVIIYFFDMNKHDDGKPANALETAGGVVFIFGSIVSLIRILHFWHPVFVVFLWIILFVIAIWKHVDLRK